MSIHEGELELAIGDIESLGRKLVALTDRLKALEKLHGPYPEFCRHPEKCVGRSSCPRDPSCCD